MASRLESIPSTDGSGVKRRTYHLGNGQEVHVYDCRALRFTAPATVPKRTTTPLPLKLKVEHISYRGFDVELEHDVEMPPPSSRRAGLSRSRRVKPSSLRA